MADSDMGFFQQQQQQRLPILKDVKSGKELETDFMTVLDRIHSSNHFEVTLHDFCPKKAYICI